MKPLDPALIRRLAPVRRLVVASGALTALSTAALVAQALAIARLLTAALVIGPDGGEATAVRADLILLAVAIAVRVGCRWAEDRLAARAAGQAIGELRTAVLQRVADTDPRQRDRSVAGLQPLIGGGLDGLHAYLGRYLPALVQAAVVPAAVVLVLLVADPLSALIVGLTLPLVPLFMALVGWYTRSATERSLATIERLAGRFADVIAGLPALVIFGRVRSQARAVAAAADQHRAASAATLRIAFLSSMVLELIATLSVALVAVTSGIRLVSGSMPVEIALLVLVLAPEAYQPLRSVGAQFHAAADGVAAAAWAMELVDRPGQPTGRRADLPAVPGLRLHPVTVPFADGRRLELAAAEFPAGSVTAIRGASGSGKSTLLALLAGRIVPTEPAVEVLPGDPEAIPLAEVDPAEVLPGNPEAIPLAEIDPAAWRRRIGWCGQRIALTTGTLRSNLLPAGLPTGRLPDAETVRRVIVACRLDRMIAELPDGLDTEVGPGVRDLSTGQRRRLGLARALLSGAPVLLLDEPTEGLDAETEAGVLAAIRPLLAGRTVVVTTHRDAVLGLADRTIDLTATAETTTDEKTATDGNPATDRKELAPV